MPGPDRHRLPLPRLLALTAAITGLILSAGFMAFQLTAGPRAEQMRNIYGDPGYLLSLALDWTSNLALTSLIVYACTRVFEDDHGALPVAGRRRVQGLLALSVVVITLAMQMLWVALSPLLLVPLMNWAYTQARPYGAPLVVQGIGLVQTIIAGLLISLATLAYARRIAPALGHDERDRPMVPAPRAAAAVFGWTWVVLQLQLMRPAYGLFGTDIMRERPWMMLAIAAFPLLPALIVWVAAARPLAELQPWRAAPGRAILAALCAFVTAQVAQAAVALALGYTLAMETLLRGGVLAIVIASLLVYLAVLVPASRLFIRRFYRRHSSGAAPASA
ncbi:hypothetical protein [Achromobacter aloeverae]|uniref:Uncharacterized protein n=1 Tax=Achromobacter aloeverae TaxID=1750518 RepID=A0A4Q1HRW0_9BURK|nr:hypothetical protein [Achromobacter aloeverae]RXN93106.1 hypothetical protein C7R54_05170 [Achromobacter aloeverae]